MAIRVGTSGWVYRDWRGAFYPDGLPQRLWLEYYATQFDTVEVNNAFYRLPSYDDFAKWRERLPDGFMVAVKASRFITPPARVVRRPSTTTCAGARPRHGCRAGPSGSPRTRMSTSTTTSTRPHLANAKTFRRLVSG
jgi:uncharacterized protein YecE (DUF72 family)